jgi:aerobic carbon-monoxide dehydrogenase medium subunit
MKRFEYFEPVTLEEASALLAGGAQALAGGTDLLVEMREHLRSVERVANIKKIPGLDALTYGKDGLRIGALVTAREVETSPIVVEKYSSLMQACRELGSIQVRNRATIVGNICRASPSADTIPPLVADGARVEINASRCVPMEGFFLGPGKTVLKPGDLVTAILVPPPAAGTKKTYIKHGRRKAMELATVGVAVTRSPSEVRIALGAVAPTVIRAHGAERILQKDFSLLDEAAIAAMEAAKPISNVRASADYRREMVRVLTRRALEIVS